MGIPAWLWFVIAAVAIAAGVALLITDRSRRTSRNRQRRRWAALRGWQFAEADQVLPARWEHGLLAQYSGGVATDIVAGMTFTVDGRRQISVFDLTVGSRIEAVLVGVRCRRPAATTVELWLPEVPVPQASDLDLLGPVGSRYAFVTDVATARPMVTPDVVDAVEEIGTDVTVVWLEGDWIMAAAEPDTDPSRLETLLRRLGELADVVDPFEVDPNEHHAPGQDRFTPEPDEEVAELDEVEHSEHAGDGNRDHAGDGNR